MSYSIRISVYILISAFILQLALGEWFYKFGIAGVFGTELAILGCVFLLVGGGVVSGALPRFPWFFLFFFIALVYLAYSFLVGREPYWVVRQGSFVFYLLVSYIFYCAIFYRIFSRAGLEKLWKLLFLAGMLFMWLHFLSGRIVPGGQDYIAMLFIAVGYAFYVERLRGVGRLLLVLLVLLTVIVCSPHFLFVLVILMMAGLSMVRLNYKALLFFIILAFLVLVGVAPLLEGLSDVNATWRYVYWLAVVVDSFESSLFILGKGFGVQYLPDSAADFERLISQVSTQENYDFQLMTVPPHNSMLEVLIYLGLPGVIAFIYPYYASFRSAYVRKDNAYARVIFLQFTALYFISFGNQYVAVPYAAPFHWMNIGLGLGVLRAWSTGMHSRT